MCRVHFLTVCDTLINRSDLSNASFIRSVVMQYTAIFHCCKNVNFQMKILFLIFSSKCRLGVHVRTASVMRVLAHLSLRLVGELIVYGGIRRPSVRPSVVVRRREHFQTTSPLKPLG